MEAAGVVVWARAMEGSPLPPLMPPPPSLLHSPRSPGGKGSDHWPSAATHEQVDLGTALRSRLAYCVELAELVLGTRPTVIAVAV